MCLPVCFPAPFFHDLSVCSLGRTSWGLPCRPLGRWWAQAIGVRWAAAAVGLSSPKRCCHASPSITTVTGQSGQAQQLQKSCSVPASEWLTVGPWTRWFRLWPCRLWRSALSQNCLLVPKLGLEWPFPGTTKAAMSKRGNVKLIYFLPASLALFYRISLGSHFYMQYKVFQIPSPDCPFLSAVAICLSVY